MTDANQAEPGRRGVLGAGLIVVLAGAVPVLMLWSGNVAEVLPSAGLRLVAIAVASSIGLAGLLWIGLRRSLPEVAVVAAPSMLVLSLVGHLRPVVPAAVLLALGAVTPVVALAVVTRLRRVGRRRLTILLTVVLASLAVGHGGLVTIGLPEPVDALALPDGPDDGGTSADMPDVWLIVPDRYSSLDTLARHGIDGTDFTGALADRGFDVLTDSRANYPQTLLSLSSAWNLDLPDVTGRNTEDLAVTALERLDRNLFGSSLQDAGYQYVHVGSWVDITARPSEADVVLTLPSSDELTESWLRTGVVGMAMEVAGRGLDVPSRHRQHAEHELRVLDELAGEPTDGPRLVIGHLLLPHEPYVFAADGTEPTAELPRFDAYDQQRRYLDDRLLGLIDRLQARPDPPIIVIASDEGVFPDDWSPEVSDQYPWGAISADQALDKMGILAAVYDPDPAGGDQPIALRDDLSLVNLMRWTTNRAIGSDYEPLPDTSWIFTGDGRTDLQPIDLDALADES